MNNMTEITGCDLVKVAQVAYDLSVPQGLGFMHYKPGPLSRDEAKLYIHKIGRVALSMDYVQGRACKLVVFRDEEGKLWIDGNRWFDHSPSSLSALMNAIKDKS